MWKPIVADTTILFILHSKHWFVPLRKPTLYETHKSAGADLTEFGGWEMPCTFNDIKTEHMSVRESAGIFDVSHMSEIHVTGPDAAPLLDRVTTNTVGALAPGEAQYSCILDENGIILDDIVIYRYPDQDGYLCVPNAGHGEWMTEHCLKYANEFGFSVTVENRTDNLGLFAVQGPDAVSRVAEESSDPVDEINRFGCLRTDINGVNCLVARTGYTGEDGFEICFDATESTRVWETFNDLQPCGLGARDTLRLEAGLLLSGQDFDPETEPRTPLEAGLDFVVDFETNFVGQRPLLDQRQGGCDQQLVGLRVDGRGIARSGYEILVDGEPIGNVTSGTHSPTFNMPLAVGYIDVDYAEIGTSVNIDVRGRGVNSTVVSHRFLDTLEAQIEP